MFNTIEGAVQRYKDYYISSSICCLTLQGCAKITREEFPIEEGMRKEAEKLFKHVHFMAKVLGFTDDERSRINEECELVIEKEVAERLSRFKERKGTLSSIIVSSYGNLLD